MSGSSKPGNRLNEALRLVFQILDFSRDLERNKEDGVFRDDGGRIDYVFDASLFEIFVHPQLRRGAATSLHAEHWAVNGQNRTGWDGYVAQTALATMEYLVDGALPGQEQDLIYISEWHRWELRWRLTELRNQQITKLQQARTAEVRSRFKNVNDALAAWRLGPDELKASVNDKMLIQDFELFKAADASASELRSYLTTRLSIAALAGDRVLEPAEQLRRLVTEPLRTSFRTLHLHLNPAPTDQDWVTIHADTRKWYDALAAECVLKNIAIITPPPDGDDGLQRTQHVDESARHRSVGALRDDARTIALVRWAARQVAAASADQKLVYVTADDVVFDAYRRWYANLNPHRDEAAYGEAFILRRIAQYAPFINLIDSGLVHGSAYRELFKELLRVLETMLLPLNLSRSASAAPETVVTRMRELMALRLTAREPIEYDPVYAPLVRLLRREDPQKFLAKLQSLMDSLREFERAALAQCNGLIDRRIKAIEKEYLSLGDGRESYDSSTAFEQYISGIVSNLLNSSGNMALPLAIEFINAWRPPEGKLLSRVPVALQLTLTVGNRKVEIGELLEQRTAGDSTARLIADHNRLALFKQPGLVFAIAAAQRATSGDWSNAQHFAETALDSEHDRFQTLSLPQDAQSAEILYLNALVRRFRLGEIGAATTPSTARRIERHYMAALRLLNACADYHTARTDEQQPMRAMRAWSERAALHLFFAASRSNYICRIDDDEGERRAIDALGNAEADLKACLNMAIVFTQEDSLVETGRENFLHKIERQFTTNIAAAAVLRTFFADARAGSEHQLLPSNSDTVRRVRAVFDTYRSTAHPAMLADLLGFLALSGDAGALQELLRLRWPDFRPGNLYLDRLMFEAVKKKFVSIS